MRYILKIGQFLSLIVALGLLAGCKNYYVVTMTNAQTVTSYTRPKLDAQGYYVLTDSTGHRFRVNSMRVREIEPHRKDKNRVMFNDYVPQKQ